VFRTELPRLYELKDCIGDPASPEAYFQNFDHNLAGSEHIKNVYLRRERALQGLEAAAWKHLKGEASRFLTARHKHGRGWQQLFDVLNEAWAYNYLKSIGCTELNFIPRSGLPTPDLEGFLGSDRILCEVKTINISDDEVAFRTGPMKARSIQTSLPPKFLERLRKKIKIAMRQMLAFDSTCFHLIYINIVFDDFLAEHKETYFRQIDDDLLQISVRGVKIVICNEHTACYKPLKMRFADVDNVG
jgi:hypothetical protein